MDFEATVGGAPEYITPDEILDHVACLLGSTANGFTVEFRGDAEPAEFISDKDTRALHVLDKVVGIGGCQAEVPALSIDSVDDVVMVPTLVVEDGDGSTLAHTPDKPKRFTFNTLRASGKQKNIKPDVQQKI